MNILMLKNIRNLFDKEKGHHYKLVKVGNFLSIFYIEYEKKNGGRNKTLSIEAYLNKIIPYLKDVKNDFRKSDMRKIQLTMV